MRITPLDVRQQQFTVRMFRGFDVQEVDAFLQDVAEDYETILKENALLKEQLAVLEERARGFADLERALQDTLVTGQRMSGAQGHRPPGGAADRRRGPAPEREGARRGAGGGGADPG